jgi:hypothetical protein
MLLQAFEPLSGAIMLGMLEHVVCRTRPRALVPRARVWLRRNSELWLDAIGQEMTEPALDGLNTVDARLALLAGLLLMIARLLMLVAGLDRRRA